MRVGADGKSFDVVVVGAGVIGLACAWRCAQRGLRVVVLERDRPGAGASGVAAGMLAPVTEADWGEEELLRLNLTGAAAWPGFREELESAAGQSTCFGEGGALVVAADRDDAEELRRLHHFQRELGLDASWLSATEARSLEPGLSPRVRGAIHAPHEHHVDPVAVVRALAAAAAAAGAELRTGCEVESVEPGAAVLVGGERVPAGDVVVAAGARSAALGGPPVRPVKGQILELRARGGRLASRLVRTPRCYVVDRGDGRVLVGATVEERGFDTAVTVDGVYTLLESAWEVLPDVRELEWVGAHAGLRPGTPDNAPAIGRDGNGVVWATGHYRNGVLLAPVTAQAVAALVAGEPAAPELAAFGPGRFALAGRAS
jgi:glycine oxidase